MLIVNVPNLLYLQRPRSNQRKQKKTSGFQTSTSTQNSYNFYQIKPSSNYILVVYVQFNTSLNESLYRQKHIKEIMKFIDLAPPHEPRLLYIVHPQGIMTLVWRFDKVKLLLGCFTDA